MSSEPKAPSVEPPSKAGPATEPNAGGERPDEAKPSPDPRGLHSASEVPPSTLNRQLIEALDGHGGATCFRVLRSGRYRDISYRHFRRQTLRFTDFLRRHGLEGERLAVWGPNSPDWMVAHVAGLLAGAVVVPIRQSLRFPEVRSQLADSGARAVVVSGAERLASLEGVRKELPELTLVVAMEPDEDDDPDGVLPEGTVPLADAVSKRLDEGRSEELRRLAVEQPAHSPATIHYAVGGGEGVLGAVFDHGQKAAVLDQLQRWFELDVDDVAYTALSWSYPPSLTVALYFLLAGVPNAVSRSRDLVVEEVQQVSPTLVLTIPNALERAYDLVVDASIRRLPESTREMFHWALATGKQYRAAGADASPELRDRYLRADRTFFSRIRGAFGGRFRHFLCTGAPLQRTLAETLEAIGLQPVNMYSVTEILGFPTVNLPGSAEVEACGPAAPGFEVRLAEDGGLMVKGPTVMRGYWRQPEATARVLSADGWLLTGDFGRLDDHGNLFLTGRKGETLILSTGRRVSTRAIEETLAQSPFVDQAVIFGEGRPYLCALLVPDLEALADHFRDDEGLGDDPANGGSGSDGDPLEPGPLVAPATPFAGHASSGLRWHWTPRGQERDLDPEGPSVERVTTLAHPRVQELLDQVIADVNDQAEPWERIEAYALLGQRQSPEAQQLTENRTRDHARLAERWAAEIRALYPSEPIQRAEREITQVAVGPERLRDLLEKESILDAWTADAGIEFLFDLAREHGIDAPSVVHICDAAANVAQMENEERPLSTALIVGDPIRIHRILPSSPIQLHRHDHIRRMRNRLVGLAKLVNGMELAYVVDRHGYVRGISRLQLDLPEKTTIFGPQFRMHAEISRRCDAVVFFVPRGGRQVRVFSRGRLAGRYANGDWMPELVGRLEHVLEELAGESRYQKRLLVRLLRCAFRMSERNLGAIFLLGDAGAILERSDAPDISHFAWFASSPVGTLTDDELINFARQDGATVIDADTSRLRACMVLLRPDAGTVADVGPGKGARHSSAAKASAEVGCLAITVSQDGPITLYEGGRRILSL
ncbi:MAG: AMP-binding protein [Acidobacteriota bacterium]